MKDGSKKNPYITNSGKVIKAPNGAPEQPKANPVRGNDLRVGRGTKKTRG